MEKGRYLLHLMEEEGWSKRFYTIYVGSDHSRWARIEAMNNTHTALEGDKLSVQTIEVGMFPQLESGHILCQKVERIERV